MIVLVIGVYLFMAIEIVLVSFDLMKNITNSNEVIESMSILNHSSAIPICLLNVNFDTRKLHLTNSLALT